MLQQFREAVFEKLEEQRENQPHCLIKWITHGELVILPQHHVVVRESEKVTVDRIYLIDVDGDRRQGIILKIGSKQECEIALDKISPSRAHAHQKADTIINDLILVRILNNLVDKVKTRTAEDKDEDIHHVQCSVCKVEPLIQTERYRCLECSTKSSGYDLCGRCFQKRRQSGSHESGHVMVHFKLPNEFLGIEVNSSRVQLYLGQLKNYDILQNEYHKGITCDGDCRRSNFKGLRFKCDTCPNYNLCERCAIELRSTTKNHQRDHPLILASDKTMPEVSPDDIQFGETLGRGGFGFVCKARWISKNRQIACKVIEVSSNGIAEQLKKSFLTELDIYRELSGPYIVRTFAHAVEHLPASGPRRETDKFMLLMEYMDRGSLQNLLEQQAHTISIRRKVTFARQIAAGMRRIHEHGIVHRDIRPDNILITKEYVAKIGDMGIARVLKPTEQHTQIGCLQFMPPEFFTSSSNGHIKCDEKLDIYTYGLTLNQLFTEVPHNFEMNRGSGKISLKQTSPVFYEEIILPSIDTVANRRPTAEFIETTLEMYEQAFGETMQSKSYVDMSFDDKNQEFIRFYQKNRERIQRILKEKISSSMGKAILPNKLAEENVQTPSDGSCRVN